MQLSIYQNYIELFTKNTKVFLDYIKKGIYLVFISVYSVSLFLLEFKGISSFFSIIKFPAIYFIAGIIFTNIPYHFLMFISFLPAKYVIPIYYIFFIYMFIV